MIARSVGGGIDEEVKRLETHSLILVVASMTVPSILGWATIDPAFAALGAEPQMLPLIHSYMDIYYPSVVLFTTTMVAGSIMRAGGNATVPGVVMTLGALFNLELYASRRWP
ncbi:MAG: MATE family efflux transporter [Gammaproteobacteria bacterium]|nr:MATE family efflux transporter [Gammaproteobacteria bacterium]